MIVLISLLLSGCSGGIGNTNIGDITANPQNYLNKKVTIEGTCASSGNYGLIMDTAAHMLYYKYANPLTGKYRLSGVIKYGEVFTGLTTSMYYIEVESASGIS
jgi:hypothetical protein